MNQPNMNSDQNEQSQGLINENQDNSKSTGDPGTRPLVISSVGCSTVLLIFAGNVFAMLYSGRDVVFVAVATAIAIGFVAGLASLSGFLSALRNQETPRRFTASMIVGILLNAILAMIALFVAGNFANAVINR